MAQKQKPNLLAALADAGGSRRKAAPLRADRPAKQSPKVDVTEQEDVPAAQGAAETAAKIVPVTGHFPKQVRDQLKILAVERGVTLLHLIGEAYNDLFAKYGKPENVPLKK